MAEVHEILRQTAGMVADELGDGWRVNTERDAVAELVRGDGARITFGTTNVYSADQLRISGRYPHGVIGSDGMYGLGHHVIGVKRERGPAVIAREIERRLLPLGDRRQCTGDARAVHGERARVRRSAGGPARRAGARGAAGAGAGGGRRVAADAGPGACDDGLTCGNCDKIVTPGVHFLWTPGDPFTTIRS
jgi:hypothetical protein